MISQKVKNIWNYYLVLEDDLDKTSRFVEPNNQGDVFSIEFYKIILLAAAECESVMKLICKQIDGKEYGNISEYKGVILGKFPDIGKTEVYVGRAECTVKPFENWSVGTLAWWKEYQEIKHSRFSNFSKANYENAVLVLSALYVLISYLARISSTMIKDYASTYIKSYYTSDYKITEGGKNLPNL